jgi:hypothetical protein
MFNFPKALSDLDAVTRIPDRRTAAARRHAGGDPASINDEYREYEMRLARAVLARNLDVARLGEDATLALSLFIVDVGTGYERGGLGFEISRFGGESPVLEAARSYNASAIANAIIESIADAPRDQVRRLAIARVSLGDTIDEAVTWSLRFLDRLHVYSRDQLEHVSSAAMSESGPGDSHADAVIA